VDAASGRPNQDEQAYVPMAEMLDPGIVASRIPDMARQQPFDTAINDLSAGGYNRRALLNGAGFGEFQSLYSPTRLF
jgi:hypothetical protein